MQIRAAQTQETVRAFKHSHDRRRAEFESKLIGMSILLHVIYIDVRVGGRLCDNVSLSQYL